MASVPQSCGHLRSQKYRTFGPLGNGEFLVKELRTSELPPMVGLLEGLQDGGHFTQHSFSRVQQYEKCIEQLTLHWPQTWGLIAQTEDKGRAEKLEKIRRGLVADELAGKAMPADWKTPIALGRCASRCCQRTIHFGKSKYGTLHRRGWQLEEGVHL